MEKRFFQNEQGLQTSADAVVFIGYVCAKRVREEEWKFAYSAIIVSEKEVKTIAESTARNRNAYGAVQALNDAVDEALEYCCANAIHSVDIIYNLQDALPESLDENQDNQTELEPKNILDCMNTKKYETMDIQFYQEETYGVERVKLVNVLQYHLDIKWLRAQMTCSVYLVLAEEVARSAIQGEVLSNDVEKCIKNAGEYKYISVGSSCDAIKNEEEEDLFAQFGIDEELPFDEDMSWRRINRKKTILDVVFEYAQSIKKKQMTSFHLLYGYACVCLMEPLEICRKLQMDNEASAQIVYVQNKLKGLFSADRVSIDPQKIKVLVPQFIERLEKDDIAINEYQEIVDVIHTEQNNEATLDDVIAYKVLYKMVISTKDSNNAGALKSDNLIYLMQNQSFLLGNCTVAEESHEDSLETIAKKSAELCDVLTKKIFGQDMAIQKFVQGYINSMLAGQNRKEKPKASYLFAGPPGVGKTYLARISSEVLGMPIKIFDMSEYMGESSAEGLVGFEKTWKASVPGVLTSYVEKNPASIILFDEIEKAHLKVQLLFLQILEGARLYDKHYEKYINFENTIVIFTTNCGKSLYECNEDTNLSALPEAEILEALREDQAFPNEMCSRFATGNMIVFNHLSPYYLLDIVRNKMDVAIGEIAKQYQLEISYDKLLPELFLFHAGSGMDARIVSNQSAEMVKENIVSLAKSEVEKSNHFAVHKISMNIKLDKEDSDVYRMFANEEECKVLVISDEQKRNIQQPRIKTLVAANEDEMVHLMRENKISLVLIDLFFKVRGSLAGVTNALGIESEGRNCLDVVRKKAPQLPVYIFDRENYSEEDKKAVINCGVEGLFSEGQNEEEYIQNLEKLILGLHIRKNIKQLEQKGQNIDYRTRYLIKDGQGVIEFYHLSLRNIGMDDAGLRRKAAQSKVFEFERPTLRFDDVIGAKQAKQNFRHFINYIQNIDKYVLEGAERPKGVLLYGPPGTGKTSLAKAFAGECESLFLNTTGANIINANDPVQEIKDLFKIAYVNAPAIIFIDEIDVIAKERNGYDTRVEVIVNTLLTEMEGFQDKDPFKPVFVVAATNYDVNHHAGRPGEVIIDPALVRRFDNPVYVGLPSREERKQYIQMLLKKKNYSERISEVAIDYVAEHTGGKSLAFLKRAISNMTNAALDEGKEINDDLLTDTLETQLYGEKRENDEVYRLNVARHEVGHAYVSWKTGREPKFITIVSRGHFGGYVSYGDGEDIHSLTRQDYLDRICQALAGRASEQVYYGEDGINTGASSDLEIATQCAISMLCCLGMGDMGLISMNPERILDSPKGAEILEEANQILREQMERATNYINEGRHIIDRVVDVLMDKSYIQGENLIAILEEGDQPSVSHKQETTRKNKWYVVINGRKPGIYTTWSECSEQVRGYSNAVYRSYGTEDAAKAAFRSSRIGVKNVRDKKLLYHLVKLSDMEAIVENGVKPDKQICGKGYVSFDFHAYAPEAVQIQRMNPKETYIYLCISREHASELRYHILMENSGKKDVKEYDYEEGLLKIDWKEMEKPEDEKNPGTIVHCVGETILPFEQIDYIYTPDDESAALIRHLCQSMETTKKGSATVAVNKRMFI